MQSARLTLAVVFGVPLILASCKLGPVDYGKFEQRTIEENLAAIDSASTIYHTQFAAGNIDEACAQAQAFLLAQEGVDTAVISPDSLVWAYFTSGLLAGTGNIRRDTTGDSAGTMERQDPAVRIATGGETGNPLHCVLPHNVELPGTQEAAEYIRRAIVYWLGWGDGETFRGSEVDLGLAAGLINPGTGVIFWSGHGTLCKPELTGVWTPGLVMGKTYKKEAMAQAAAHQFAGYFKPGAGKERQVAVMRFVGDPNFSVVVLPEFIRANGDFDNAESLPFNACKTLVHLSCCYSAYPGGASPGPLVQAFLDAGADLVCGYTWEVGDAWSCDKDEKFFSAMVGTCLPMEAKRTLGNLTDPKPRRGGYHAEFGLWGDTLVLLQAVVDAKKGDKWYRSCPGWTVEMYASQATKLYGFVRENGSADDAAMVTFLFPSTAPGGFDLFSSGAYIQWDDIASGHTYSAQAGYVGTGGTLTVDQCTDSLVVAHFTATLGWWDAGKNPYVDQPDDTFGLQEGVLKYSGKIAHYGLGPLLSGYWPCRFAGAPSSVR